MFAVSANSVAVAFTVLYKYCATCDFFVLFFCDFRLVWRCDGMRFCWVLPVSRSSKFVSWNGVLCVCLCLYLCFSSLILENISRASTPLKIARFLTLSPAIIERLILYL